MIIVGLKSWLMKKKQDITVQTEQMRAEMLRERISRPVKKGSMREAYMNGLNPVEFGRMKKKQYIEKRKD